MSPAFTQRARIRVGIAAGAGVVVAAIVGQVSGLAPGWVTVMAIVLAASGAFAALPAPPVVVPPPPSPLPSSPPAPTPPPNTTDEEARWRSLRHDLRGILSPALLMSDRLLMATQDPLAKRTAEAMIEAIERSEKRLSRDPEGEGSAP